MTNVTKSVSGSPSAPVSGRRTNSQTASWRGRVVTVLKGVAIGFVVGSAISALFVLSGGVAAVALPIILGAVVASSTSLGALGGRFIYEMLKERDLGTKDKRILRTPLPVPEPRDSNGNDPKYQGVGRQKVRGSSVGSQNLNESAGLVCETAEPMPKPPNIDVSVVSENPIPTPVVAPKEEILNVRPPQPMPQPPKSLLNPDFRTLI
jgi:hypothetical protein